MRDTVAMPAMRPRRPPALRRSGGSDSRTTAASTPAATTLNTPMNTKIERQPNGPSSTAPMSGARMGARPLIIIMSEKARAACFPTARSATTARARTTPAPPAMPCTSRPPSITYTSGANAQTKAATAASTCDATSRRRRPSESDIGPMKNCPNAMPAMNMVRVSWTIGSVVPKSCAMTGKAGRYVSMDSGPAIVAKARAAKRVTGIRGTLPGFSTRILYTTFWREYIVGE